MAKPWARIEIGYLNHPKFLGLNANAICLWHEGKNYCDTHLTDGLIPRDALKTFRFASKKAIEMLTLPCQTPKSDGTPYAALWDVHPVGFKMHDYLDHNDCRDAVLARIGQADERRHAQRQRKADWRAKKRDMSRPVSRGTSDGTETSPSRSTTLTDTETPTKKNSIEEPDAPLDEWFVLFAAEYPEERRRTDAVTQHAWVDAFVGVSDAAAHFQLLRARLANHVASDQWATRNVIPSMTKWLTERRWVQTLKPAAPVATTSRTANNIAELQKFINRGQPA